MSTETIMSRKTAEELPFKAIAFLQAIGANLAIRDALVAVGYTDADQQFGWDKALVVLGRRTKIPPASAGTDAARATVELDNLDEELFRRGEAVLRRFHPDQADFVFTGLSPSTGREAVVGIATFLSRLDQLESGEGREATREQDQAALVSLATRGITKEERTRLAELLVAARQMATPPPAVEQLDPEDKAKELAALRAWYQDWADTARAAIKRRDLLVRLGLTKRKKSKSAPEPVPPTQPAPVAVPVLAAPGPNGAQIVAPG